MIAYDIIKKPLLSEKSYATISDKKYTFVVDLNANKIQIKQAIVSVCKHRNQRYANRDNNTNNKQHFSLYKFPKI